VTKMAAINTASETSEDRRESHQQQERHLAANDDSKQTQHRIQNVKGATVSTGNGKHTGSSNMNLSKLASEGCCTTAVEKTSEQQTNSCRCANGRGGSDLQTVAPSRTGLSRRLNAVVRDRIIFFSKKEQPAGSRKTKSSHSNS